MKLIVQIPCYNEEEHLAETVAGIPRRIPGVDRVEVLVVDDGSTDRTAAVARRAGVDHVVRHASNRGLAVAFRTGLDSCLKLGADVIVNTDADNQYPGEQIPRLIEPLLAGRADVVIGDRQTAGLRHFSPTKRRLQKLGSAVVERFSATEVPDAVSGFRALSRSAAAQINIVSDFSYTIEMLIQAGRKRLAVEFVPIRVNPASRQSRLFRSLPHFIGQSIVTMVRSYTLYRPLRVFTFIGLAIGAVGIVPVARFVYFFSTGAGGGHVQSLVLGAALLVCGFITLLIGLLADLIASNRRLLEMVISAQREADKAAQPGEDAPSGDRDPGTI